MKENIIGAVLLFSVILVVYFVAILFRADSTPRGVPEGMVGNCTQYGDCY